LNKLRSPTNRDMWRIAAPMILSNISVPLLGMVDTGVMGHLESATYLGAVAIGGTIFTFLYMGMNFLRMGTTGIAAQSFGAEDFDALRVSLGQALVVSLAIAFAILLLQTPLAALSLSLLGGDAETQVHAATYFSIRVWSAPGTLANYVLIGWFLGLQNARVPLAIFLTINVTNIVLDLVFVLGFGMKIEGVALASVIAEYTALAVAVAFALRELRRHPGRWLVAELTQVSAYRAFFSINANLFIRTMALMFTLAFVTAQGARLGPTILAANAVLMNFQNLTALGLDGIAHAAEALVGKAVGQKNVSALRHTVGLTLRWSLVFALGFTLAYIVAGPVIVRILTDLPEVRDTAMVYLPWLAASPLISVWCFLYDGVYIGMTRARQMRNIMVFSSLAVFIPVWYLTQTFGNHGLWFALMAFLASRGIGMHIGYRRALTA
jgi:MATE family multidrug resistance protein